MEQKVNNYYQKHFDSLHFSKQFHFASRLWLWSQDPDAANFLKDARSKFCGDGTPEGIKAVLQGIIDNQGATFGTKNAAAQRAPYFAKYPLLPRILPLLFRLLFIESIYGIDARDTLADFVDLEEAEALTQALLQDAEATAILSTHASNFLYLWNRFYKRDEDAFPIERLYEIGQTQYDLNDHTQLQLYVYLYTHCIIGESIFYKRAIPEDKLPVYRKMAAALEATLEERYDDVNLDNKYETLVSQMICGTEPRLKSEVDDEAAQSFAPDGDFIIDKFNNNPQKDNITLEKSEHRNVLCIMSGRPFTPATNQTIS